MTPVLDLAVTSAQTAFYARAWYTPALADYLREQRLELDAITRAVGAVAVIPIVDCGAGRFEFGKPNSDPLAFVCEAVGEDGESVVDLVAWHLTSPEKPLTMLGRVGLIGLANAFNPATFTMGRPLDVHRTPLDFLKAGGKGAAVVDPRIAAYEFLDVPGPIAGRDQAHSRQLLRIAESVVDRSRFLAASRAMKSEPQPYAAEAA
jgi:hypothetical protein